MEVDNSDPSEASTSNAAMDGDRSEENSGVEFPGTSLEPFVGTSLTISDQEFH
jgi:hypothetical protein